MKTPFDEAVVRRAMADESVTVRDCDRREIVRRMALAHHDPRGCLHRADRDREVDRMTSAAEPDTYEEWRVTGTVQGEDYDFTWSKLRNPHLGDPEQGARKFAERLAVTWDDGPHLHHRTIVIHSWLPDGER